MTRHFLFISLLTICVSLSSCYKKKKNSLEGVYIGEERHIHKYNSSTDTISDSTYVENINVELFDKKWFRFTKAEYPETFDMCANKIARRDSLTISPGLIPLKRWTVYFKGDSLYGTFIENNGWAGTDDHYYFAGKK